MYNPHSCLILLATRRRRRRLCSSLTPAPPLLQRRQLYQPTSLPIASKKPGVACLLTIYQFSSLSCHSRNLRLFSLLLRPEASAHRQPCRTYLPVPPVPPLQPIPPFPPAGCNTRTPTAAFSTLTSQQTQRSGRLQSISLAMLAAQVPVFQFFLRIILDCMQCSKLMALEWGVQLWANLSSTRTKI